MSNYLVEFRDFFIYCFVDKNCPILLWIWTLNKFRELYYSRYEDLKEIKYEHFSLASVNTTRVSAQISKNLFK